MKEFSLEKVCNALNHLYESSNPESKKAANNFLEEFQDTKDAWEIASQLLVMPGNNFQCHFFGASTLYLKISRHFSELESLENKNALRNSLIFYLFGSTGDEKTPKPLSSKIAQAIAAIAVQMEEWTDLGNLISNYAGKSEHLFSLLSFLEALPNECHNCHLEVSNERRLVFGSFLVSIVNDVVSFLMESLGKASLEKNFHILGLLFKCFLSWLRCCQIPCEIILSSQLIPTLFSILNQYENIEVQDVVSNAVELICDLMDSIIPSENMNSYLVAKKMLETLVQCNRVLGQSVENQDDESIFFFTKILSRTSEDFLPLLMEASQLSFQVLDMLLIATSHIDFDCCEGTFDVWRNLAISLSDDGGRGDVHKKKVELYVPYYWKLLDILLTKHLRYPKDFQDFPEDFEDDFKRFRRFLCAGLIRNIFSVCGHVQCLSKICQDINVALQSPNVVEDWEGLEALLYSLRSSARELKSSLKDKSQFDIVFPYIFGALSLFDKLPSLVKVQYTSLLLIGRLSDWIGTRIGIGGIHEHSQGELLGRVFLFVIAAVKSNNKELIPAASLSFLELCTSCSKLMSSQMQPLFELFYNIVGNNILPNSQCMLEIVEGMCCIVNEFILCSTSTSKSVEEVLFRFCSPFYGVIESFLIFLEEKKKKENGNENEKEYKNKHIHKDLSFSDKKKHAYHAITSLGLIFKLIIFPDSDCVITLVDSCWNVCLFPLLTSLSINDERIISETCNCTKNCIKVLVNKKAVTYLNQNFSSNILKKLEESYVNLNCCSSVVYCLGECMISIKNLRKNLENTSINSEIIHKFLMDTIHSAFLMITHTFKYMSSPDILAQNPDVFVEMMNLGTIFLEVCPLDSLRSGLFESLLQWSLGNILQFHHRESYLAFLMFLDSSIKVSKKQKDKEEKLLSAANAASANVNSVSSEIHCLVLNIFFHSWGSQIFNVLLMTSVSNIQLGLRRKICRTLYMFREQIDQNGFAAILTPAIDGIFRINPKCGLVEDLIRRRLVSFLSAENRDAFKKAFSNLIESIPKI